MNKTNITKQLESISLKLDELENSLKSQDDILSFNRLSEYLQLSKSYLYKLTMTGKIPHYKPLGKRVYFSKKEIDKWVKSYFDKDIKGDVHE